MTRHVLITGGAGFIGRHLTSLLRDRGHFVRWLDTLDPQIHGDQAACEVDADPLPSQVLVGDVRDRAVVREALEGIDTVVHFAAQTGTGQSMYQISHYTEVNVGGTAVLWDVIANDRLPIHKFVVASSRSVYGEGAYRSLDGQTVVPDPRPLEQLARHEWAVLCPRTGRPLSAIATSEDTPLRPASLYACTKLAQEQMTLTMGTALGISTAALRFQNVYGPGQSLRNPYTGIISIFSNQMRQALPINLFEDGEESRDFVFVGDVADACSRAIESDAPQLLLNVGSGEPTTVSELAAHLKRLWNSSSKVTVTGDFRVGDIRHNWADMSAFRAQWSDWSPTSLADGLEQFVAWARQQPAYLDQSQQAAAELQRRGLSVPARKAA